MSKSPTVDVEIFARRGLSNLLNLLNDIILIKINCICPFLCTIYSDSNIVCCHFLPALPALSVVGERLASLHFTSWQIGRTKHTTILCVLQENRIPIQINDMDASRNKAIEVLKGKGITCPENIVAKLDEKGLDKTNSLVDGDTKLSVGNFFEEHLKQFTDISPAWIHSTLHGEKRKAVCQEDGVTVNLFWTQFSVEQQARIKIIRKKRSGLCYLHAPVVLEHYLNAIATGGKDSSTYDIGKYGAYVLSGEQILNLILEDKGGNSRDTLDELCGLTKVHDLNCYTIPDKEDGSLYSVTCQLILERVALSPALISLFHVYPDFGQTTAVSFSGLPAQNDDVALSDDREHSMVLIGARKTSAGEYYFLLQNWWQGRYFIEVSLEYMHNCQAQITFFKKPITRKCELTTFLSEALYAETSSDASETCNKCYER